MSPLGFCKSRGREGALDWQVDPAKRIPVKAHERRSLRRGLWSRVAWVQIPGLLLSGGVTSGKELPL